MGNNDEKEYDDKGNHNCDGGDDADIDNEDTGDNDDDEDVDFEDATRRDDLD